MLRFIDDLAGALKDILKTVFIGLSYFLGGFIFVAVLMYVLMYLIGWGASLLK